MVVKNWLDLPWHLLCLRTLGHWPFIASSVDASGITRKTIEVRDSPRIELRKDAFWGVLGKIEVIKSSGGGRLGDRGDSANGNLKGMP